MNLTNLVTFLWEFLTRDVSPWGGLHSPMLSWLGAGGMLLYFGWHVGQLLQGVRRTAKAFRRIDSDLSKLAHARRRLYGEDQWLKARLPGRDLRERGGTASLTCTDIEDVRTLDKILQDEPVCRQPWAQYRKTLVVERVPWFIEPRMFSTYPAGEFFSQETLFAGRLNLAFYHQLPSLMTGAGLLLTFVAILVGLSKLHAEGATIVGIDGLINGLAGKFLTSIVGLICANLFVLIEHRVVARLTRLHHEFLDALDELFPRKTLEQMVEDLALPTEGGRRTAGRPRAELSDGWHSGTTEQLRPAVDALTAAARSLNGLKLDDRSVEIHLPDDLATVLRESLEPNVTKLGDSIQLLIGSLAESRAQQKEQQVRLETILTRLSRHLEQVAAQPRPERLSAVKMLGAPDAAPRFPGLAAAPQENKGGSFAITKAPPVRTIPVLSQSTKAFSKS
jgi:hypothetical protein